MDNAFSRLLKIISLERKQGYRNKAVIGGLDKFASRWEADARAEATSSVAVSEIIALLIGYPAVEDTAARERIIEQIIRRAREAAPREPAEGARSETGPSAVQTGPSAVQTGPSEAQTGPRAVPAGPSATEIGPSAAEAAPDAAETGEPLAERAVELPVPTKPTVTMAEPPTSVKPAVSVVESPASAAARPAPTESAEAPAARLMPARSKPDLPPSARTATPPPAEAPCPARPVVPPAAEPPMGGGTVGDRPQRNDGTVGDRPQRNDGTVGDRPQRNEPRPQAQPSPPAERPEPAPMAAEARPKPRSPAPDTGLNAPVSRLPGVGPSYMEKLGKLGVQTVRDLLFLLPHRYDDFSRLRTIDKLRWGEEVTVIGTVWSVKSRIIGDDRKMVVAVVGDGTGEMEMTWFSPYVERQLQTGRAYTFAGRIDNYRGRMLIRNPEFEALDREQLSTGRLVPVYPLTEGITVHWLRAVINKAIESFAGQMPDSLPEALRQENGLLPLTEALRQIHFPDNNDLLAAAHRRLSFDEFFLLQLGVLAARQRLRSSAGRALRTGDAVVAPFLAALPFSMTAAQRRVLTDIAADLGKPQPMSRLLQGDVGSGKTAVAAAALWTAVANGHQGAIMAPTEILAEQHARSFEKLFAGLTHPRAGRPVRIALLTGSQKRNERDEALAGLAAGEIDIAVGTHALIQGEVTFRELAVAVVDEQHRFGVEQRAALRQKGVQPHLLVMSATPIPRSLALTIYGDLDVSVIDEMPAGRTPIKTKWLTSSQRERAYDFIRRQAVEGRQAFIIYPLVEESEHSEAKAAVEEHARLKSTVFPNLRVGLLHGRMKGDEKDAAMRAFSAGDLDVLVATSVVEVGIDVPNATVIVIEGAERFGLAQLHQFRGRVGRGPHPSYCILISDAAEGEGMQRLQALEKSTDGFALAQTDLEMRGPGDFLGTRQSGLPPLHTAKLGDLRTLELARAAAKKLFEADPDLARPEHRALAAQVAEFWAGAGDAS